MTGVEGFDEPLAEWERDLVRADSRLWRTGRKVGRTVYIQVNDEPSDADRLVGVMDTRAFASLVVDAVNAYRATGGEPS